ncbi:MAG: 16S rRNA (adenine(1518)-N(6)/adenine(1519)-N(6))-dimethyltransferase RsmA [bacterium]
MAAKRSILIGSPRPRKELGQHFLQDEEIAYQIVHSMDLRWEDRALEIGPGRGILLRFLLKQCRQVTAVELDIRLAKTLKSIFGGHPGLTLVFDNFQRFDLESYVNASAAPVKVVGNIPYFLSSVILFRLFELVARLHEQHQNPLKSATLMLQREVAQRLCATAGGRVYGTISIFRALVADAELLFDVPGSAFFPPPRVTSAVVQLRFFPEQRFHIVDFFRFQEFVHHIFAQRRKMLKNTVNSIRWVRPDWRSIDADFSKRPEEFAAAELVALFHQLLPSQEHEISE